MHQILYRLMLIDGKPLIGWPESIQCMYIFNHFIYGFISGVEVCILYAEKKNKYVRLNITLSILKEIFCYSIAKDCRTHRVCRVSLSVGVVSGLRRQPWPPGSQVMPSCKVLGYVSPYASRVPGQDRREDGQVPAGEKE